MVSYTVGCDGSPILNLCEENAVPDVERNGERTVRELSVATEMPATSLSCRNRGEANCEWKGNGADGGT